MKTGRFILLFLLITACNMPRVAIDYDQQVNFEEFTTYAFYPRMQSGLRELDEKRLLSSLERGLQEKGLRMSASPDLYVNMHAEEYEEPTRNSLGIGVGGTGRNVGIGVSGGIPLGGPRIFLRLTFNLIDADEDMLLWQAVVEHRVDPQASPGERQAMFDRIVQKALEEYPPES